MKKASKYSQSRNAMFSPAGPGSVEDDLLPPTLSSKGETSVQIMWIRVAVKVYQTETHQTTAAAPPFTTASSSDCSWLVICCNHTRP